MNEIEAVQPTHTIKVLKNGKLVTEVPAIGKYAAKQQKLKLQDYYFDCELEICKI